MTRRSEESQKNFQENEEKTRAILKNEIRKLSYVVEQSPNAIMITDLDGIVEYINPAFTGLSGFTRSQIIGELAPIFNKEILDEKASENLWKTVHAGRPWEGRLLNYREDQTSWWGQVSVSSIRDPEDKITYFLIIMVDITKQIEAEEKMKKAMALRDEFTSTVSHELRTPLAICKQALSFLSREKKGPLNDGQKEYLKMAGSNIDRLAVLINDLLDISKLESGKMELHKETVNILSAVRRHVDGWKIKARAENISLTLTVPEKDVVMEVDEARFIQILSNLISNAVKFTPQEGRVDVSVKDLGGEVEFIVRDTGIGIAHEDMPRLFKKFQQIHRTDKSGLQGTGLGLSVVQSLVDLHEGHIQVKSEVDKGSVFIFTIPKIAGSAPERTAS